MSWPLGLLIVACAVLPAIAFALWVRAHEKHEREPIRAVLGTLAIGGTTGILVALLLNILFEVSYAEEAWAVDKYFMAVVIIAPIAEELAKGASVLPSRRLMDEVEDGIIYGVAAGLGFAATENIIYAMSAFVDGGITGAASTLGMRIISSMVLHGAASGLVGFGIALVLRRNGKLPEALPYLVLAVLLHALYNGLVSYLAWVGIAAGIVIAAVVTRYLQLQVKELDRLPHELE